MLNLELAACLVTHYYLSIYMYPLTHQELLNYSTMSTLKLITMLIESLNWTNTTLMKPNSATVVSSTS